MNRPLFFFFRLPIPRVRALQPEKAVFDLRAHFCHSAPMEMHAFGFRLRANAPEGQKRFPISFSARPDRRARAPVVEVIEKTYKSAETGQARTLETTIDG